MKEQFIPYELALKLKELGFDEECFTSYNPFKEFVHPFDIQQQLNEGEPLDDIYVRNSKLVKNYVTAPLWQQAFDWFREKYELEYLIIKEYSTKKYFYTIRRDGIVINGTSTYDIANTYTEAQLFCLNKLIEIVEQQNK